MKLNYLFFEYVLMINKCYVRSSTFCSIDTRLRVCEKACDLLVNVFVARSVRRLFVAPILRRALHYMLHYMLGSRSLYAPLRASILRSLSNKTTLYSTRSCVNWAFLALVGPLMPNKAQCTQKFVK
jgi:hypothetical protein